MKRIAAVYIALIALIIGCQESVSPYSDNIRLLTSNTKKVWSVVAVESADEAEGINCEEDDILTLELFDEKRNQPSFSLADGFVKCDFSESSNVTDEGTWRLNNAQTRIILTSVIGELRINNLYDIIELSERKMILRRTEESYHNLTVTTTTITYESL